MAHHDNDNAILERACVVTEAYYDALERDVLNQIKFPNNEVLRGFHDYLPDLADSPDMVDRLLQRLLDYKYPVLCAWMVALVYGRIDSLYRLSEDFAHDSMDLQLILSFVRYLPQAGLWSALSSLFDHFPHLVYGDIICVRWRLIHYSLEKEPAAVELFEKFVSHTDRWQPHDVPGLVHDVMQVGREWQFRILVDSPLFSVREAVEANLKSLFTELCIERIKYGAGSERSVRLGACFLVAAQVGLWTAGADLETRRECMVMAAVANQSDLVQCLHHCATLGSRDFSAVLENDKVKAIGSKHPAEVWRLLRGRAVPPFNDEAKNTALGIKSFLAEQASTSTSSPVSLEKTCLQHLLKQAGWGFDREETIRDMGLPQCFEDHLRFKGLEDMLKKA